MRVFSADLQQKLQSGITTFCRCFMLTRKDGQRITGTDHDQNLTIDDIVFEASPSFITTTFDAETGLSSQGGEVSGALSSDYIRADEVEAGFFDGAELRIYLVDWQNPTLEILLHFTHFGEIRRKDGRFIAEARDLFYAYDAPRGRLYHRLCDAHLGDQRCRFALTAPPFRVEAAVSFVQNNTSFIASDLSAASDFYTQGEVRFISGLNKNLAIKIKEHRAGGSLILWQNLTRPLAIGDRFIVTAGCDKRANTCRAKFNNILNYQGFPYIPESSSVYVYAREGDGRQQGRPRVVE